MAIEKPTTNDYLGLPDIHYNPLQNYRSVTYNTRLTMMPPSESLKSRPDKNYDYKNGIIIWETGGSGTTYLEELTMEINSVGNNTANYFHVPPSVVKGKLSEPLGGRLIEAISLAAMQMGYSNNNAHYLLEISFSGYDTDSDMPAVCKSWEGTDLVYRWYMQFSELHAKIDYKGSMYDFTLMSTDGEASLNDYTSLEQGFRMKGGSATIGEFCKELGKALEKREEDKVKQGRAKYPHKWVITAHKDIANLKFSYPFFSRSNWAWTAKDVQAPPGTSIQQFIVNSMPNSQDVLKYLHRIPEKKEMNAMDTKPDTAHLPIRTWAIFTGLKIQEKGGKQLFDQLRGSTVKEIHYYLTTKEDPRTIISPQEYDDATDPDNRKKRVDNWIKKGYLRKVYKWIYTGENTEVIKTEIKIDNMWRQVRPLWIDEDGNPISSGSAGAPAKEKSKGRKNKKNQAAADAARRVTPINNTGKTFYAEDMPFKKSEGTDIAPREDWYPHQPQYFDMNIEVAKASQQNAVYQESAQEYSIYRQVANNMASGATEMHSIDLEVVGDPYWFCQVPSEASVPPWTDDVWEYEAKNLVEEDMLDKRKITSTSGTFGYVYFEAQIPSVDINAQDLMDLRRSDAISGVYMTTKIVNKLSKGKFTTKLSLLRESLCNPWNGQPPSNQPAKESKSAKATGPSNAAPRQP